MISMIISVGEKIRHAKNWIPVLSSVVCTTFPYILFHVKDQNYSLLLSTANILLHTSSNFINGNFSLHNERVFSGDKGLYDL